MASRFLVIVARPGHAIADLADRVRPQLPLPHTIEAPGLIAFANAPDALLSLPNNSGLIAGSIFSRSPPYPSVTRFSDADAAAVRRSLGADLGFRIWGGYLAFVRAPDTESVAIVREPTAALPCVYLEIPEAVIFASDVGLLVGAGLVVPRIDMPALARHLALSDLKSSRTCLAGVRELLAGSRLTVSRNGVVTDQIWSPWDYVGTSVPSDVPQVSDALESIVADVVAAWARPFRNILLGASGGLDSSIIAAVLARQLTQAICLNMTTDEGEGDERRYARLLAEHLSLDLREAHHRLADVDVSATISGHLARPASFAFGQSERRTKATLVESCGIDALFTGIGGDNVFCSLQSATPLVDYIHAHGLDHRAWSVINDICDLTGASMWQVLQAAWARWQRPAAYPWSHNHQFLTPNALDLGNFDLGHPWLTPPAGALPGKASHVAMLLRITGTIDGFPRDSFPPQINPLVSQPIIEACLAIPTWQWIADGRNRSIARRAFTDWLPQALIARQSKGGPDSFAYEVMETHKATVRDLLLGGLLARHDLIDRPAIEEALRTDRPVKPLDHIRLAVLAEAETWTRHWSAIAPPHPTDPFSTRRDQGY